MTNKKIVLLYIILFVVSLVIRLYMINQDKFLNPWDEQYHAMVAKNMMTHPLEPMLYSDSVLSYDYKNWNRNHIWVHKQPLFLWQSALSMKIFGANEFAMRLASAILSALLVLVVFRIGIIISGILTGFIAALLMMTNQFHLMQISGAMGMDHNDVSFMVYVAFSIWVWLEYEISKKNFWLVLLGVFVGCAVLCKWLTGLLVYAAWGIDALFIRKYFFIEKNWLKIFLSLIVCLLVFLPWQFYILYKFPIEARNEFAFNEKHLTEVLEGHAGNFFFHFIKLPAIYFKLALLIPLGMITLYFKTRQKWMWYSLMFMMWFIYLFFSFAKTKFIPLTVIVMPIGFLFIASAIETLISFIVKIKMKWAAYIVSSCFVLIICLLNFKYVFFMEVHRPGGFHFGWGNNFYEKKTANSRVYRKLSSEIPSDYIIINCPKDDEISCMFYSGKTSYNWLSDSDIKKLKTKGLRIASFLSNASSEVLSDNEILKIPYEVK